MSQNLHLLVRDVTPLHRYDAVNGVLTLETHGLFSVTLKELQTAIAQIDAQIAAKVEQNAEGIRQATAVFEKKAEGGFTDAERRSNAANNEVRNRTHDRLQREMNALQARKTALVDSYENVKWCWQIAGRGVSAQTVSANTSVPQGLLSNGNKRFGFPQLLEGGGLCWLEAFREGTDPATGNLPNGLYVQATGTPRIVRCEWTDYLFNPITEAVGFGSEVLLHIYTRGLFGQQVNVGLMDRDLFTFNDLLNIKDTDRFIAEINVEEIKPFEIGKPGIDGLLSSSDDTAATPPPPEQFIQKVTLPVLVDPKWKDLAGSTLKVYPVVKTISTEEAFEGFDRAYLNVSEDGQVLDDPTAVYTNNPVVIDEIETNAAHFAPCKYTAVKVTFPQPQAKAGEPAPVVPTSIYLFNEADPRLAAFRDYEIVSGYVRETKTVTVELENVSVVEDECRQPAGHKHAGKVLRLTK